MKTIRRVYFYLVAAISVELMVWGVINLLRSIINSGITGNSSQSLSTGLAQVFVSIPIFLIHWLVLQKDAGKSEEEQTSVIRAMFLYGILLGTFIPVIQNILAVVNRLFLETGGASRITALVGRSQTTTDNLIAIVINLIIAWYFYSILKRDWKITTDPSNLIDLRRIYRYFWMLYGLGMTILGVQMLIQFILRKDVAMTNGQLAGLVNPVTLLLLGAPIWVIAWLSIQKTIIQLEERYSTWRIAILYILSLAGGISTATSLIFIMGWILRRAFGEMMTFQELIWNIRTPVSYIIPMAIVWAYYVRHLRADIDSRSDLFNRQAMLRVYRYIPAFLGLAFTVSGLIGLLRYIVRLVLQNTYAFQSSSTQIAQNVALLLVGLVYWLVFFLSENRIAMQTDEAGEHARRSLTRKIYLYVIVFAGVVGVMVSAGSTIYLILEGIFGGSLTQKLSEIISGGLQFLVFGLFLWYHLINLRRDSRAMTRTLVEKHTVYPVAMAVSPDSILGKEISLAFLRHAPAIPLSYLGEGDETESGISSSKAVVIPASVYTQPDSKWQKILSTYPGKVISLPEPSEKWLWIPQPVKPAEMAKSIALMIRSLAEGRPVQTHKTTSVWLILGYVLGGLIILQILLAVLGTIFVG